MFPTVSPSSPLPVALESGEPYYVLLVCGLRFDTEEGKNAEVQILRHHLLNWLLGNYGGREEQEKVARVVRVIIAGNSVMAKKPGGRNCFSQVAKYLSKKMIHPSVEAASSLDIFLKQLANYIPVDLMPGETDPTNNLLPQQALHSCMFRKACRLPNFNRVTNPYCVSICGITFLGTSGQNIDDLSKHSVTSDRILVMLNTLKWGHLCPTMPDTLGCYPYENDDPFIIKQLPHVYFAANQPTFASSFCVVPRVTQSNTRVRLLSLPSFCESGCAALVNLRNLAVEPIIFKTLASKK
ncbi:DNA polymerase epsilon subunit B [Trichuris suis]|nr:DNA polymerase epsilon subunit B [Trichuris suis]